MLAEYIRTASRPVIHENVLRHLDYVTGLHNIPRSGPVVIVANHTSYADHFLIMTVLHALRPGEIWYPTKAEAFEGLASRVWHESMHCFAVHRESPTGDVFRKAKDVLEAGHVLVVYPEGTRGSGGELLPFKSGAFRMALSSDAPVIPVGLANVGRVLPKGARRTTHSVAGMAVGEVLNVPSGERAEVVHRMRDDARRKVERLIEKAHRPAPSDRLDAVIDVAGLMDQIVTENLDRGGRITPAVRRRLMLLDRIGRAVSKRNDAALDVQRVRFQGFQALTSRVPAHRLALAAVANRRANRLAEQEGDNAFAAYLAARTNVMTPSWLGGNARRAHTLFEQATADPSVASKAYVGLGHLLLGEGRVEQAAEAWSKALRVIDVADPRGEARRIKVEALLNRYPEAS